MIAATTPAAMPIAIAAKKSMLWLAISPPAAAAPMPTRPNCPRLIWPAHPVNTTSDTATMPNIGNTMSWGRSGLRNTNGRADDDHAGEGVEHAAGDHHLAHVA